MHKALGAQKFKKKIEDTGTKSIARFLIQEHPTTPLGRLTAPHRHTNRANTMSQMLQTFSANIHVAPGPEQLRHPMWWWWWEVHSQTKKICPPPRSSGI